MHLVAIRSKRNRKQVSYLAATKTAVVTATKLLNQPEEEIAYIPLPDGFAGTAIDPIHNCAQNTMNCATAPMDPSGNKECATKSDASFKGTRISNKEQTQHDGSKSQKCHKVAKPPTFEL
jgi:hypothetical protein